VEKALRFTTFCPLGTIHKQQRVRERALRTEPLEILTVGGGGGGGGGEGEGRCGRRGGGGVEQLRCLLAQK